MKKSILTFTTLLILGCSTDDKDWEIETPTFEDFKTSSYCNVTSVQTRPNLRNTDFSLEEKKEIREEYLAPDNYMNCIYSTATIGGHNDVWRHIIINTQSGEIIGELESNIGITFSKQSALIILNPISGAEEHTEVTQYWIIEGDELKRIK